jgi:hypothetical protein
MSLTGAYTVPVHYVVDDVVRVPVDYVVDDVVSTGTL